MESRARLRGGHKTDGASRGLTCERDDEPEAVEKQDRA